MPLGEFRWNLLCAATAVSLLCPSLPALAAETATPQAPAPAVVQESANRWTDPKTGIEFVLVPGGEFSMGSADGEDDEKPVHQVRISDFWMGKTEITVAQLRQFVEATGYLTDSERQGDDSTWRKPGFQQTDNDPVVYVSWNDATAYLDWAGYRLPTEAEWEYAAGNGKRHTLYSWGSDPPSGRRGGNVADETGVKTNGRWRASFFAGFDDGYLNTAPVCTFDANDFGLCDMTGNVWEWVQDWHGDYPGDSQQNPAGPPSGSQRIDRGGGRATGPQGARVTRRDQLDQGARDRALGFRAVRR